MTNEEDIDAKRAQALDLMEEAIEAFRSVGWVNTAGRVQTELVDPLKRRLFR
jgi:hypothetical protein